MVSAHTSQEPVQGDINNGAGITLGARVMFAEAGAVSAIRFWVPATNSGTYTVGFYQTDTDDDPNGSGTGTLLTSASVASGSVTPSGWAEVPITPQDVEPGVIYTCAVHSSSGRYVRTASVFASGTPLENEGITLIGGGADPNPPGLGSILNGVFAEGAALAYPNSSFEFADYFVDVNYGESGPPVVLGAGTSEATSAGTVSGVVTVYAAGTSTAEATSTAAAVAVIVGAGSSAAASSAVAAALVRVFGAGASAALSGGLVTVTADVAGRPVISITTARVLVTTSRGAP